MTERSASPATAPVAAAPADQPTPPTEDPSTTTEDRMSTQPTTSTTVEAAVAPTSAERLSRGEPYVLAFGGQATPWRATLDEFVGLDRDLASVLVGGGPPGPRGHRPADHHPARGPVPDR